MCKSFIILCISLFFFSASFGQAKETPASKPDTTKPVQIVEASCGQCKFSLSGQDCDLAVRIDGKAYFVDGTDIDEHGDAHAKDGFCNSIRKAEVQGEVVNNRFKVSYFKLLKAEDKKASN